MQRPMDDLYNNTSSHSVNSVDSDNHLNHHEDRKRNSALGIADLAASSARAIRSSEDTLNLGSNYKPGTYDVICARGNRAFQHPGNKRFRDVVKSKMDEYSAAGSKFQKSMIVASDCRQCEATQSRRGLYQGGEWLLV